MICVITTPRSLTRDLFAHSGHGKWPTSKIPKLTPRSQQANTHFNSTETFSNQIKQRKQQRNKPSNRSESSWKIYHCQALSRAVTESDAREHMHTTTLKKNIANKNNKQTYGNEWSLVRENNKKHAQSVETTKEHKIQIAKICMNKHKNLQNGKKRKAKPQPEKESISPFWAQRWQALPSHTPTQLRLPLSLRRTTRTRNETESYSTRVIPLNHRIRDSDKTLLGHR